MTGKSSPKFISPGLQRVAQLSLEAPEMVWTTLAHHIDIDLLREAYRRTRKDGAAGVDGQTAEQYGEQLELNLQSLLDRFKSGTYQAPPVRRVHIPKGDGSKTRPIGIPTFEDKVLQRAVTMVLEAIYEQDFKDGSHGFRPGRSPHTALKVLWRGLMDMGGGWVYEVDIQKFFDTLDHAHLRSFLDVRVRDGVIRRMINKWLKAGVMEGGELSHPELGTPQGGVISPLLANLYLHEVLDKWFEREVIPRLKGQAFLIRYADDFVIVFSLEEDARRVMEVLPKRFDRYGLKVHPDKTRLVRFIRPSRTGKKDGGNRPETFDLLGFTFFWAKSRKGIWVVKNKTAGGRFARAMEQIQRWCRLNRHLPVPEQQAALARKLRGHYQYYGITGNSPALARFFFEVTRIWRKWLDRRSQRARMSWDRFAQLLKRYPLPKPVAVHSELRQAARP